MSAVSVPACPLPSSILLWDADELRDPPAAPCWAARGVLHLLGSPVPRSVLLADDLLAPVFRHLRGRRGLPEPAACRLMSLLGAELDRAAAR
jgi:hypothetical protein